MFKSVNRISVLKCLMNDGLTFSPRKAGWIQVYRCSSGVVLKKAEAVEMSDDMSFTTFLQQRQDQARRSFYARAESLEDCEKLLRFCKSYGSINNAFHCEERGGHYILVEMNMESNLHQLMLAVPYGNNNTHQFMVFNKENMSVLGNLESEGLIKQSFISVTTLSSKRFLNTELSRKNVNLSDFIKNCYEYLRLGEFEIRKKFLLCRHLEILCGGFLPGIGAYPFGSSVSGLGINGCDLDIALLPPKFLPNLNDKVYLDFCKDQSRSHLSVISDILKTFNTCSSDVLFIKHARVPIVKFKNRLVDVHCDLSMYNSHGVAMSQMLYSLSSFDWKVKALVLFMKLWLKKVGILHTPPGTKLSGFSVSAFVFFFLQQIGMLPPLNIFPCTDSQYLMKKGQLISESVLLREKQKIVNSKSVDELFKLFLEFYIAFDFKNWGISIKKGIPVKNIDKYPLFIENPIYEDMNIASNVRHMDIFEIRDFMSNALRILKYKNDQSCVRQLFGLSVNSKQRY